MKGNKGNRKKQTKHAKEEPEVDLSKLNVHGTFDRLAYT